MGKILFRILVPLSAVLLVWAAVWGCASSAAPDAKAEPAASAVIQPDARVLAPEAEEETLETRAVAPAYGQLRVIGTQLSDEQGSPVQLTGMSTMGLQWYGGIVNEDAFTALAKDWECDVLRLALYVGENGYATDPSLKDLVETGIELSIERGVYVVVDWHVLTPGNPNDPVYAGAEEFFREISAKYGGYPHLIYEIMNEPNGPLSWQRDLKPYAEKMVGVIRENDPDNVIVIGSGTWSQDVDVAAADPVAGENLMYAIHFYSGTHGQELRDKVVRAMELGAAVICTEWGTSQASGTGGPYIDASEEWLAFFDEHRISWINWSLCNKNETSAAFKGLLQEFVEGKGNVVLQEETPLVPDREGADRYPVWDQEQLSVSGAYVRAKIKGIEIPVYETPLVTWNFDDGSTAGWHVADDSGAKPALSLGTAESPALAFRGTWAGPAVADAWSTAPRIRIADTGLEIGAARRLSAELYLEAGKQVSGPLEVNPVLQYPPTWWTQLPAVKVNYAAGEPAGNGLLRFPVSVPLSLTPDVKLAHLLFVVVGNGSGYEGEVYLDNIAFSAVTNGDASVVAETERDDPGEFSGLPWSFEEGGRQGWIVTEDSPAKVKPTVAAAESAALAFSYGWTVPGPDDPWNAAPRLSSSWVELPAARYSTLTLEFFVEPGKASTGSLQVQPVIQSPQHGYWFQLDPATVRFSDGEETAAGLLKYTLEFPLTSGGAPMKPDAVLRNLVLITIGLETDYSGIIAYDNITFE